MLQATGLTRSFGDRVLFADLAVSLRRGETLAITGPSGVGKTQLLRMIACLVPHDAQLLLEGRTPKEMGVPRWRSEVCWVPQTVPNLPGTPRQHAEFIAGLWAQQDRAIDDPVALAAIWMLEQSVWDQPWSALSGGEAQRALLAIATARRPKVLLLDEPTGSLDIRATEAVESTLARRTVLWVSHDPAQIQRVADAVLELS